MEEETDRGRENEKETSARIAIKRAKWCSRPLWLNITVTVSIMVVAASNEQKSH